MKHPSSLLLPKCLRIKALSEKLEAHNQKWCQDTSAPASAKQRAEKPVKVPPERAEVGGVRQNFWESVACA